MSDQTSEPHKQNAPQIVQAQPAQAPATSPPPVSNVMQPDKTTPVPQYIVCMAGNSEPIDGAIHGVTPKTTGQ